LIYIYYMPKCIICMFYVSTATTHKGSCHTSLCYYVIFIRVPTINKALN